MTLFAHVKQGLGTRTSAETKTAWELGAFGAAGLESGDVYGDIIDVSNYAGLSDGDYVIFSHLHNSGFSTNVAISSMPSLNLISVDDSAAGNYLSGATESTTSSYYLLIRVGVGKTLNVFGVNVLSGDRIDVSAPEAEHIYNDATISNQSGLFYISLTDSGYSELNGCYVDAGSGSISISNGSSIKINGGSLSCAASDSVFISGGNAGGSAILNNVDMSSITAPNLFKSDTTSQDSLKYSASRCKLPVGINIIAGDTAFKGQEIDIWSCDIGDGYHYFQSSRHEGKVLESTQIKRTNGATYDGINGFSAEFRPNSNVVKFMNALKFMIKAPKLDLTVAGGVTLTVHILLQDSTGIPTSLTDMNCVLKAVYPDSTDLALGKTVSSTTKGVFDTPADLSTEALSFAGTSGTTKQHTIAVTIPQNVSMSTASCELWLELSVDLAVTTEMFVCPDPTVS